MMSQFIESLRRLYQCGRLNSETLAKLLSDGKISKEDELYILSK